MRAAAASLRLLPHLLLLLVLLLSAVPNALSKSTLESCASSTACPALLSYTLYADLKLAELAALFAAAAAMVSRQEDIGATTTPITMLIMAPYFLVIFFNDNPVVLTIMSYVPFSAPVGMPLRMYLGHAQWWDPVLSLLVLLASCVLAIGVAARIYRNSLLRMGARVKLGEALRG